jgi:hypothetical protein
MFEVYAKKVRRVRPLEESKRRTPMSVPFKEFTVTQRMEREYVVRVSVRTDKRTNFNAKIQMANEERQFIEDAINEKLASERSTSK